MVSGFGMLVAIACGSGTAPNDGGTNDASTEASNGCAGTCVESATACPKGTVWNQLEPTQSGCPEGDVGQMCCVPVVDAGGD